MVKSQEIAAQGLGLKVRVIPSVTTRRTGKWRGKMGGGKRKAGLKAYGAMLKVQGAA